MFTLEELFSEENQKEAIRYFLEKPKGRGLDGIPVSEIEECWRLNGTQIMSEIREGNYEPAIVESFEHLSKKGKVRTISKLSKEDRFITRLLAQKLKVYLDPLFMRNSFAYQEGKGILDAVMIARDYMQQGKLYLAEIDLKNYFDNIPLERLMKMLEEQGLCWMRFADNIYIFESEIQKATEVYNEVCRKVSEEYSLEINSGKSGVYEALTRRILGYEFYRRKGGIEVRRHKYKQMETHGNWHTSVVRKVNKEYHIIQDGILNKQDYSLLFENEEKKYHIPVEAVEQLNLYGEVTLSTGVFKTLASRISGARYTINTVRWKGIKQPPQDPLNALISFGNTLLYNRFLQAIWKTSLDPRVGIVHATNQRSFSLNLDLADIYKPIIVDRVIFSLINLYQIKAEEDFEQSESGGVYLNKQGKRAFIEQFEQKLTDRITIKGKEYTYGQLMEEEVRRFLRGIMEKEKYKPYKYY